MKGRKQAKAYDGIIRRVPVNWHAGSDVTALVHDDQGKAIIPIGHIMEMLEQDKWELIQRGYEASHCNDEGAVDYGSTIQFYMEDKFYRHPYHTQYSKISLSLYETLMHILCRQVWDNEFPNGINPEAKFRQAEKKGHSDLW